MAVSVDQFTEQFIQSGLIGADELRALLDGLPAQHTTDAQALARELVRQQKLTAFQAQQVYQGKGRHLVLGEYVVLDKLGQGGMGLVLKVQHRRMKRTAVLKMLSPAVTRSPEALRRFQREVEAAAKLEHPNIVIAHDAGEAAGTHFLVMQFFEGTDLAALVRDRGPLPVENALSCIVQAARGLEYAHGRGVVHRDIKPSNLLVDSAGTVKILDMGLARLDSAGAQQDQLTGTGQIMGTVDFMAPEQAMDTRHADARADIYSLGVTLWYLLTGRALYEGDTTVMKLMAHQSKPIPSLCGACPAVSAALQDVFRRMVAKTPAERFQTMSEVIAALNAVTKPRPAITAEPGPAAPVPAAGEDTRLEEFLRWMSQPAPPGARASRAAAVAARPTTAPPQEETVAFSGPAGDTDPKTEQSLVVPALRPPTARRAGRPAWRQRWQAIPPYRRTAILAGCAAGAAALLLAGVLFFLRTKDGVLRVEINDPSIEVSIQGEDVILMQADNGADVRLSPGEKTLVVQRGDFKFETDKLILKRGETVTVDVNLLAGTVEVRQGERLLGSEQLPAAWHGWPADAPPPAIAPFDAAQAKKHQQEWAAYLGVPVEWENSLGMKFALIPPGEFQMGSTPEEIEAALVVAGNDENWKHFIRSEAPRHTVVLTQPFYLGMHEVTQAQYERVMGTNPSHFAATGPGKDAVAGLDTSTHPVEQVSWNDAAEFCAKLSEMEELKPCYFRSGETVTLLDGYGLPTEAQWEVACRAGTTTRFWSGDHDEDLVQAGWFVANSGGRTHSVGELKGNPLGLFDIHGNVWEWVQDGWEATYYGQFQDKPTINPSGPSSAGSQRVIRGGNWYYTASSCRASDRYASHPPHRYLNIGFRVALAAGASRGGR